MSGRRILLVLGGTWHDFDGFDGAMTPFFEEEGYEVESTYDLSALEQLDERDIDLVLMYTCIGEERNDDGPTAPGPSQSQVDALVDWVQDGGGLLAAHAATVAAQTSEDLRRLMGGIFVTHPPAYAFNVYPVFREHPITEGIEAFTVHDEFYQQIHDPSVDVHMVAVDRGVAYPMVWSKEEGDGRVAHVAMGHGPRVWAHGGYQRVMLQAAEWLTA